MADLLFTVSAEHDETSDDPTLTSLTGNAGTGEVTTFTPDKASGSLTASIVNHRGTTLPGTGGIGTTIFYVVGGGLMVAAAILLITKKRMENREALLYPSTGRGCKAPCPDPETITLGSSP